MKETVDVDLTEAGISESPSTSAGPRARGTPATEPGDPCVGRAGPGGLSGQANACRIHDDRDDRQHRTAGDRPLVFAQKGDVVRNLVRGSLHRGAASDTDAELPRRAATGLRIANNKYNDRSFTSNDWPNLAHNWLATIDHISNEGDPRR